MGHTAGRRALIRVSLVAAAVTVTATGCQGSSLKTADMHATAGRSAGASSAPTVTDPPSAPTGSATVKISWKPRDVGGTAFAPILAGYEAYIAATLTLEGAPDPSSPRIAQVATGQAQQDLVKVLTSLKKTGASRHGSVTMRPWITAADPAAGTATIEECADFSHYFQGRQVKPAAGSQRRPIEAKLSKAGGAWRVTSFSRGSAVACTGVS